MKLGGKLGVMKLIVKTIRLIPGVNLVIKKILQGEVQSTLKNMTQDSRPASGNQRQVSIPSNGVSRKELLEEVEKDREKDGSFCQEGRAFALVYYNEEGQFEGHTKMNAEIASKYLEFQKTNGSAQENEREQAVKEIFETFAHGNALNPLMFPSLKKYETEVISMTAGMLNGDAKVVGAMTSGGTESILMVVKAYREYAKTHKPQIKRPEIIAPITIHPAHEKGGDYFGVKIVHCPVNEKTKRADVGALEKLINSNTVGIALSAPQYCHGAVDPVEEVSQIAQKHNLLLHVDACYGGFILPWIEKLGYAIPKWDFRVPGVTSITADIHKYGYCPKGASVVLFRNEELRKVGDSCEISRAILTLQFSTCTMRTAHGPEVYTFLQPCLAHDQEPTWPWHGPQ